MSKLLVGVLCAALAVQSAGCGTIFYPERRGQKGGRIDAGVAVLDGIGLLFFIIPGVIAFAVDFGNGTIYLPGTEKSKSSTDARRFHFDPRGDEKASVEAIVRRETGYPLRLDRDDLQVLELHSPAELSSLFSAARRSRRQRLDPVIVAAAHEIDRGGRPE